MTDALRPTPHASRPTLHALRARLAAIHRELSAICPPDDISPRCLMRDQIERFDMQASLALLHGLYEVAAFPREVSPSERAVILTAARAKLKAAYRQAQRLCDAETRRKVLDRRERIVNLRCCLKSDDLFFTSCQTAFPELDADQVRLELELWARDLPRAMKRAKAKGRRAKSKGRRPRTEGDEGIPY